MIPPSPRTPTRVTTLALAIAFLAAAAFGVTASRLERERVRVPVLEERLDQAEAQLQELRKRLGDASGGVLDRIQAAVARLRGLSFKQSVKATVLSTDALRRQIVGELQKSDQRAEIQANAKVLRALGLLTPTQDLYTILLEVQQEQIGGYYDTDEKTMFVAGDAASPSPLDRTLLAHEFTHALTDQHFDLTRLDALSDAHKDDEAEALLSLIEGDATYLMGVYVREVLTTAEQGELGREAAAIKTEKLDAAPKVVRSSLQFPYDAGTRFVQALFARGGNEALDRAYRDPPVSTEQILHPEKYYGRRDAPTTVTMPDLAGGMGTGWRALQQGGVGELDVRLILGEYLARSDTNSAAEGWDGGKYSAVESQVGVLVASLTVWDSATEAAEAAEAFGDWLPRRFPGGAQKRISGFTGRAWESRDGAGEVLRSGDRVLVIVGPDLPLVERARSAFRFGAQA